MSQSQSPELQQAVRRPQPSKPQPQQKPPHHSQQQQQPATDQQLAPDSAALFDLLSNQYNQEIQSNYQESIGVL